MRTALIAGMALAGLTLTGFAGAAVAEPISPVSTSATVQGLPSQVPPGSPGDENGNGQLDSSETPDNPDAPLPSQVPPGSPGDENGNGQLDSSETPDNPDL